MSKKKGARLRADAARLLDAVLQQGRSLRDTLPEVIDKHPAEDKAWIHQMVYGCLREMPTVQAYTQSLLKKPLKQKQSVVTALIYLGIYQIQFSRVADHGAVSASVDACELLKQRSLKGLVNAVLRGFLREQDKITAAPLPPAVSANLPTWLFRRLQAAYRQDELEKIIAGIAAQPPLWLRVNRNKLSVQALADKLNDYQPEVVGESGVRLRKSTDVTQLPGFAEGEFSVQDGAAQLAAPYLGDFSKPVRILDACAAPGGKTAHLIERLPKQSHVTALELDPQRIERIHENLARLGHSAEVVEGDASQPDNWWDGEPFEHILLDAPCSATGVIRRHPDIKYLRKDEDIAALSHLQGEILQACWSMLAPGGTLLYATCSILPEENIQQIQRFIDNTPAASPIRLHTGADDWYRQILPGEQGMDGFFYAKLKKS